MCLRPECFRWNRFNAFVDETDEQTDDDAWSFQEYDNNLFSIEYDQKWNYEDKGSSVSFNYFDGKVAFGILAGPNDQQLTPVKLLKRMYDSEDSKQIVESAQKISLSKTDLQRWSVDSGAGISFRAMADDDNEATYRYYVLVKGDNIFVLMYTVFNSLKPETEDAFAYTLNSFRAK